MKSLSRGAFRRPLLPALWLTLATLLLSGCAGQQLFRLHLSNDQQERKIYLPSEDIPRYMFAGELVGERNFVEDINQRSLGRAIILFLAGLLEEPDYETRLLRPQSGMVDQRGRILVTDVGRPGIFVFDPAKASYDIWKSASQHLQLVSPSGITQGPGNEIWVSDADLGAVIRLDAEGVPLGSIGEELLKRPAGLHWDDEQKLLYVADVRAHEIKVFDADGALVDTFGSRGDFEPGQNSDGLLNTPTHIAFKDGELYVADSFNGRIQVFDRQGHFLRKFGTRGVLIGQFSRPKGIALDSEKNVYVVESYFDHLLVHNPAGQLLLGLNGSGRPGDDFVLPSGVWTDKNDRVYVADMFKGRVVVYQFLGGNE